MHSTGTLVGVVNINVIRLWEMYSYMS